MKNILSLIILAAVFATVVDAQNMEVVPCPAGTPIGCICMRPVATPQPPRPVRAQPVFSPADRSLLERLLAVVEKGQATVQVPVPSAPAQPSATSSSSTTTVYTVKKETWDELNDRLGRLERRQNDLSISQNQQGERIVAVEQTANDALKQAQQAAAHSQSLKSLIGTRGTRSEKRAIKAWDAQ